MIHQSKNSCLNKSTKLDLIHKKLRKLVCHQPITDKFLYFVTCLPFFHYQMSLIKSVVGIKYTLTDNNL